MLLAIFEIMGTSGVLGILTAEGLYLAKLETRNSGVMDLSRWRFYLSYATPCTFTLSGFVMSINEEGQVLLKSKQDSPKDTDNSLRNWKVSDPIPCFWNGVKCTQDSVSVLDLSLIPFCNLTGDILALSCAKFANLSTLNVGYSSLNGNFPEDILNCSKLVSMNLSLNLQQLQVLDRTHANIEGTVVTRFNELQELRVLRLAKNHFEGQMPQSILSLSKLEELTLSLERYTSRGLSSRFQI